ncbi:MAG: ABC transporter permease, partial [Actinomycetota bacterium]|nr:ABC transporter permease [Actinomycetota bacterium]
MRPAIRVVGLVARREFDSRVRTKSFVIGLLVTVLLLGAIIAGPVLVADDGAQRLGVVGDTGSAAM